MTNKVGTKGQIVIEKPIREKLGLEPGYLAVQKLVGDHIEVYFYPPEHEESLLGRLAGETDISVPPERWEEAREQAWSNAVSPKKLPAE